MQDPPTYPLLAEESRLPSLTCGTDVSMASTLTEGNGEDLVAEKVATAVFKNPNFVVSI